MAEAGEKLLTDYLTAISKLSLSEAAEQSGIPKSTISKLKRGKRPSFHPETWRKIEEYVDRNRSGSVARETPEPPNLTASVVHLLATDPERIRELVALLMDEKIRPLWDKG
jgi:transcriptional regulator with XRE-family HTH domain